MPDEQTLWVAQLLETLSLHFEVDQDEALRNLIEHHPFEDVVTVDALFLIATQFDDGHGVKEIRLEGSWRSTRPRLHCYGGDGYFLRRELEVHSSSAQALNLGTQLRGALIANDLNRASDVLVHAKRRLLDSVNDDAQRTKLQQHMSCLLR